MAVLTANKNRIGLQKVVVGRITEVVGLTEFSEKEVTRLLLGHRNMIEIDFVSY